MAKVKKDQGEPAGGRYFQSPRGVISRPANVRVRREKDGTCTLITRWGSEERGWREVSPEDVQKATIAGQIESRAREAAPELLDLLKAALLRVEMENEQGNLILSAWAVDARATLAKINAK